MGSCIDLTKYQDADSIIDAYSKVVSGGKMGYRAVVERKKIPPRCEKCGRGETMDKNSVRNVAVKW